ncbi:MAG: metal-dependent transcriptional regulator [Clostridia bacterium]|nr:metal-dependent transcriptional regulator [Clostridia bacterium]
MNIHESAEDYLETILILKERNGYVRSIDIVKELEVSKPSVSVAMKKLRENGYIEMNVDGFISLLPSGLEIARKVYGRHKILAEFFVNIGVSEETASHDACKIEHDISEETFNAIRKIVEGR